MTKLHLPKPNHKVLIIGGVAVLVLGTVGSSIATYQKHQDKVHAQAVQQSTKEAAAKKAQDDKLQNLQVSLNAEHAKRASVCGYVTRLSQGKLTRTLVTVPIQDCAN